MTVAPEHPPPVLRRTAVLRGSAEAIREAATTAAQVALTYDTTAADAAEDSDPAGPPPDRAAWARTRADEQRRLAVQMWARVAALDSTAR